MVESQKTNPHPYRAYRRVVYALYGLLVTLLIVGTTWGVVRGIYFPEQIPEQFRTVSPEGVYLPPGSGSSPSQSPALTP